MSSVYFGPKIMGVFGAFCFIIGMGYAMGGLITILGIFSLKSWPKPLNLFNEDKTTYEP